MGIAYPLYGTVVEVGTNAYTSVAFTTVSAPRGVVTFTVPSQSELGGHIIGAYVDLVPRVVENTFAGVNHVVATSTCYARVTSLTHGTSKTIINYMDYMFYCTVAGEFPGKRYYGNNNLGTFLEYGGQYTVYVINAQAIQDQIYIKDLQCIVRYVIA